MLFNLSLHMSNDEFLLTSCKVLAEKLEKQVVLEVLIQRYPFLDQMLHVLNKMSSGHFTE